MGSATSRRTDMVRSNGVLSSVIEAIGDTPLVDLRRLTAGRGRILAKLDYLNPGFSKKDRIARSIIEDGLGTGELQPGQPVVELTSGNAGTGLAIVCGVLGHPFTAVMSAGNSVERAQMMRALGAEVVTVPQAEGSEPGQVSGRDLELVEQEAQRLAVERGAFRVDQFKRVANRAAHETGTGPELWRQSSGELDAFCDFVGSGGTFAGVARYLRSQSPDIRCYIVEPDTAPALAGRPVVDEAHPIQGGGYSMPTLALLRDVEVDGYLTVSGRDATEAARLLAAREGIFAGYSSGAVVAAALRLLDGDLRGATVAVVLADSGMKYLSTPLWQVEGRGSVIRRRCPPSAPRRGSGS